MSSAAYLSTGAATSRQEAIETVLSRYGRDKHALVQVQREVQAPLGWLPRDSLAYLAVELGLTLAHVEGVATFYRFFHTQPVGDYRVLFSDNVTDRMQRRSTRRPVQAPGNRTRAGSCRRAGQRGHVFVHRLVRSGPGPADQPSADRHQTGCRASRADRTVDRVAGAGGRVAGDLVGCPRADPATRCAACRKIKARRGHRGGARAPTPLFDVVANCITIRGSFVGNRRDMAEALAFAADGKVKADIELQSLSSINKVFDRLAKGEVPSRVVLDFSPR